MNIYSLSLQLIHIIEPLRSGVQDKQVSFRKTKSCPFSSATVQLLFPFQVENSDRMLWTCFHHTLQLLQNAGHSVGVVDQQGSQGSLIWTRRAVRRIKHLILVYCCCISRTAMQDAQANRNNKAGCSHADHTNNCIVSCRSLLLFDKPAGRTKAEFL